MLERARTCVVDRDLVCARARLKEHATQFPSGALADEAAVLEKRMHDLENDSTKGNP